MSLQAALETTVKAASNRAAEGQKLFTPIASFLDKHLSSSTSLSPHLLGPLSALSIELSLVAQRHFDAFISGSTPGEALAPRQVPQPPSPPSTRPPSGLAQSTYAVIASSNAPAKPKPTPPPKPTTQKKATQKEPLPDNRLFVRLDNSHAARGMQGYAILTKLRTLLGPDGPLLKEVQTTKTGFALCPTTPDALKALEARKDIISSSFGNCPVERGSRWVSYRVTNVPRKVGQITDTGYDLLTVDSQAMAQAVLEATTLSPASVTETTHSISNPTLPYSSWFVNFPEGTLATIPRQLHLFGTVATAVYLPRKTTTIQCNRCWMWHNARSCARPPKCRLCGSTQHTEENHSNRCDTPSPHSCPPRCAHCHGPHPADSTDCLLRLKAGVAFTKRQKAEIRRTCFSSLTQARTDSGCTHTPPSTEMAIDSSDESPTPNSTRPSTPPPPPPPSTAPSTSRAVRFIDHSPPAVRYSALSPEEQI